MTDHENYKKNTRKNWIRFIFLCTVFYSMAHAVKWAQTKKEKTKTKTSFAVFSIVATVAASVLFFSFQLNWMVTRFFNVLLKVCSIFFLVGTQRNSTRTRLHIYIFIVKQRFLCDLIWRRETMPRSLLSLPSRFCVCCEHKIQILHYCIANASVYCAL